MIFEEHYDKIPDEAPAEMQRTSLETVVLKAKQLKMGKPIDILGLAMNPPPRCSIVDAVLVLKELGALTRYTDNKFDYEDGDLTFVGEIMSNLPVDVRFSKLILLGYMFNVLKEMIIIAAGLSVRSIFRQITIKSMESFETKFRFGSGSSDVLALLNVYKEWTKFKDQKLGKFEEMNFVQTNKLDWRNLRDMRAQVDDIMKRLMQLGFSRESLVENIVEKYSERTFLIKCCIAGKFFTHILNFF
jgi:ATP-dependent RNA helicase TDRD9